MQRRPRPNSNTPFPRPIQSRGTKLPRLRPSSRTRGLPFDEVEDGNIHDKILEFGKKPRTQQRIRPPKQIDYGKRKLEERKKLNAARKGKSIIEKTTFATRAKNRSKNGKAIKSNIDKLPMGALILVFDYSCSTIDGWFQMIRTCRMWKGVLDKNLRVWRILKKRLEKRFKNLKEIEEDKIFDAQKLGSLVKTHYLKERVGYLNVFLKKFGKLYEYNSTMVNPNFVAYFQMNLPNKLFIWLDIVMDVQINGKTFTNYLFKVKKDNYLTFINSKILEFSKFDFSSNPVFEVAISFRSLKIDITHTIEYRLMKQEITGRCIKTKVFNYFLEKNLGLVFFEGDKQLLFGMYEISATQILLGYLFRVLRYKQSLMQGVEKRQLKLFTTKIEKIRKFDYPSIEDYLKDQTDFEVIVSLHNGRNRIFYFINTTAFPFLQEKNPPKSTNFYSKNQNTQRCSWVNFQFEDIGEPLESDKLALHFSNELGISEKMENLLFCEIIIKNHQEICFLDSGIRFVNFNKLNSKMNMAYQAGETKFAQVSFEEEKINFKVEMIFDQKMELMRLDHIEILVHPSCFLNN